MSAREVGTFAGAARVARVTPATVRGWVAKGWLPKSGPWSVAEVRAAARRGRQRTGRGTTAEHGTASRWRAGCQCAACTAAHNEDTRARRAEARAQWWQDREGPLLAEVAEGAPYGEVLRGHGVTAQAITGHRRRSPEFARALDVALLAGRDPELSHGSATGWRAGCRCPECREHHERSR